MKSRGAPPPSGAAPAVSREIVNIVKKKLAAPSGPPPTTAKSIINRGTAYRGIDEDDDDDNVDDEEAEIDEKEKYLAREKDEEPRRSNGAKEHSRSSSEFDNVRSIDSRNNYETDDRSTSTASNNRQGQFQQPRRAPYRTQDNDDDDDDDQSSEYESDDNSGHGKGSRAASDQQEQREHDQKKRTPTISTISTSFPSTVSEGKPTDREQRGRNNPASSKGTTPRKPATYNFQPLLKATYRELRSFVLSPCEPGITTKCYIERTRGGGNMFAPVYSLCADLEDGTGRELLVCRKVLQSMSSHYVFSLKSEDLYRKRDQRSRLFLGKLRSSSSSEYVLYDNGMVRSTTVRDQDNDIMEEYEEEDEEDKEKEGREDSKDEVSLFRKELAVIYFNTKKRPAPLGVRGSEICIPTKRSGDMSSSQSDLSNPDRRAEAKDSGGSSMGQRLQQPFQAIRSQGKQNQLYAKKCFIMHERTSRYDPLSSCLVDFKGRANMASVKNFQLVQSYCLDSDAKKSQEIDAERDYILQVGKTTAECFNMDYRYPLSMLQAFAIAIARFDAKLSW